MESLMLDQLEKFQARNIQEVIRGFIIPNRGSKQLFQILMPRIQQIKDTLTCKELCYILYAYHKSGFLPKPLKNDLELKITGTLRDIENIQIEEILLMA